MFGVFANPIALTILGVVLLLLLGVFFGFAVFLTFNVFTLLGAFLVIMATIMLFNGMANQVSFALMAIGIILILLPVFSENLGFTLAAILA